VSDQLGVVAGISVTIGVIMVRHFGYCMSDLNGFAVQVYILSEILTFWTPLECVTK